MKHNHFKSTTGLILVNILLILGIVLGSLCYSQRIQKIQMEVKISEFENTVESFKKVSQNYLDSEKGYVENWGHYINEEHMTLEEALQFLRTINTNENRIGHIVDMDTFIAYSSYYEPGDDVITTYQRYLNKSDEFSLYMQESMREMFDEENSSFNVLGRYIASETGKTVVSVGVPVHLVDKDYLLLRVMTVSDLRNSWVFPAEYTNGEMGIMTNQGDYVIQSESMTGDDFIDCIETYNFSEENKQKGALQLHIHTTDSDLLQYKNYKGEDCYWYYSSFGNESPLDIVGVIPVKDMEIEDTGMPMVLFVCFCLSVLMILDGMYMKMLNTRLKVSRDLAQQASLAKSNFLSSMSHDLRTPMNAVMGFIQIAKNNLDKPEVAGDCLNKATQAGKQLLTLVNDILDVSKIESGKLVLSKEEVDLQELMKELVGMMQIPMQRKDMHFTCVYTPLPYRFVLADRIRLNQIYTNLLSNAVKYTEVGGNIDVSLKEEKSTVLGNVRTVFRIQDNGIGMDEEFQKHMYDSFTREVKTQINKTQGTGLGLSIVKQMVDLFQGTIECESEAGKGTVFTVTLDLPIVDSATASDETTGSLAVLDVTGLHVLVCEDNNLNWEIVHALLNEAGVSSDRCENGKQCLDVLNKPHTYDAILMDVQMPVMNGLEATKKIRESGNSIPIAAMTADAYAEDIQKCKESGMNYHIAKPIEMSRLMTFLILVQREKQKQVH